MNFRLRSLFPLLLSALAALPLWALAATPAPPRAGVDYEEIEGGRPFSTPPGRIEVVEVFGYTCPHCAHFEPILAQWKKKQPKDVAVVPVAAPFGGHWEPYAKAFYAARELGIADRSHQAVFDALHANGTLPASRPTPDELAAFYAGHGTTAAKFIAAYQGPQVERRMQEAREFLQRSGVESTPSLIVAGKYRVIGGNSFADLLRIAEQLIARERAALKSR